MGAPGNLRRLRDTTRVGVMDVTNIAIASGKSQCEVKGHIDVGSSDAARIRNPHDADVARFRRISRETLKALCPGEARPRGDGSGGDTFLVETSADMVSV